MYTVVLMFIFTPQRWHTTRTQQGLGWREGSGHYEKSDSHHQTGLPRLVFENVFDIRDHMTQEVVRRHRATVPHTGGLYFLQTLKFTPLWETTITILRANFLPDQVTSTTRRLKCGATGWSLSPESPSEKVNKGCG